MGHSASVKRYLLASVAAFGALCFGTGQSLAGYVQTNLVSDISGLALRTDLELVNPWGMSEGSGSPFWTSNQATNTATLYPVVGSLGLGANPLVVTIAPVTGPPSGPTGQVSNTTTPTSFLLPAGPSAGQSARFMFANLNGTISGWTNTPAGVTTSTVAVTTPGAVYTGLAINQAHTQLYAADNAGGHINVFDSAFAPVSRPGAFVDPGLPPGFVPFNVQDIGGKVYVTYVPSGLANQRNAIAGQGIVDVYDENGNNLQRLITGSQLASPWGVALAPAGFGAFGGDLLVGNFSFVTSEINAFDPTTGAFEGSIPIDVGAGNTPGGLWGFMFGSGVGSGGDPNTLYFNDGIDGETHGLFGALTVPEPSSMALLGVSAVLLGARRARSRRRG